MLPRFLQSLRNQSKQQLRDRYLAALYPLIQKLVEQEVRDQLAAKQAQEDQKAAALSSPIIQTEITKIVQHSLTVESLQPVVQEIINQQLRIWGDPDRLKISPTANLVNTLLNTAAGNIEIGDYTFTGHNVSIITGSHDYQKLMADRMADFPKSGRDITIGNGVWIGSNATVLGPCQIGDHAVIAAGAVVIAGSQIPAGAIVAGVPAKVIKQIFLEPGNN